MNYKKFILVSLCLAVIAVTVNSFVTYRIQKDFLLVVTVACDPEFESCFIPDCSPDTDPECEVVPYKKITLSAKHAPDCLYEHTCEDFICNDDIACSTTYCSDETRLTEELCSINEKTSHGDSE